jgi:hypothetical protein
MDYKMKTLLLLAAFLICLFSQGQKAGNYMVVKYDETNMQKFAFVFVNQKGDTVTRLDRTKYTVCFSDTIQYFAVVGLTNKSGWWAIDKNEKLLFQVYNTSSGEPTPDELREGMIRIVDEKGKIGFANYKGEIVIKPQFESVTSFYRGKAIVGRQCKQVLWCCEGEGADKHYITECRQTGYINKKGNVQGLGNFTFEEIQKKIGWKSEWDE